MSGISLDIGASGSRKDPDFYYDDGNIVLAAKDSENCTTYFRLHRSILVKQSPVFADMFSMPPPPDADTYDGVALVEMPDDATALRAFIALLYDPQCISGILDSQDFTLRMFWPTLLAKKYQVDWICAMVASQLEKQWPTTLTGWDIIAQEEVEENGRTACGGWTPLWDDNILRLRLLPEPVSAIRLARECGALTILPFAFFHLLRLPLEPDEDESGFPGIPWVVERSLLSPEDTRRLTVARERIGKWFFGRPYGRTIWKECGAGLQCEARTFRAWSNIAQGIGRNGDVLQAQHHIEMMMHWNTNICTACKNKLSKDVRILRDAFVGQLSTFFQLDEVTA